MQNSQVIVLLYGNRLIKFFICMIVPLIKKLRSIFSNKRHCLKQAFQERTLTHLKDASEMHPCRLGIETGDCSTLCALCPSLVYVSYMLKLNEN